ncbi:MAG: outer membrane lipoprotein-sorting protein [Cytophagaceae bacterium]|nr:outer membrane lipoprotein-sorting protein [Cytophagaceae bacterium]
MKKAVLFLSLVVFFSLKAKSQTAEEIINRYIHNVGGQTWNELDAVKMKATLRQNGMNRQLTIYQTKDGKQAVIAKIDGKNVTQLAFDGINLWQTDIATQKPKKLSPEENRIFMESFQDFPSPFFKYKEKGYAVKNLGTVTKDGIETFKVSLRQPAIYVDGEETTTVSYYYFEKQNFMPIVIEIIKANRPDIISLGDFREVEGFYFPYSISQNLYPISIKEILINPEIDPKVFQFVDPDEDKKESK